MLRCLHQLHVCVPSHAVCVRCQRGNHLICYCSDEKQANNHAVIINVRLCDVWLRLMVKRTHAQCCVWWCNSTYNCFLPMCVCVIVLQPPRYTIQSVIVMTQSYVLYFCVCVCVRHFLLIFLFRWKKWYTCHVAVVYSVSVSWGQSTGWHWPAD